LEVSIMKGFGALLLALVPVSLFAAVPAHASDLDTPAAHDGLLSLAPVAAPSGETLLGVIDYKGGFGSRLRLNLPAPQVIKGFHVEIPSFCKADILEAGTVTEGVEDLAEQQGSSSVYKVNNGAGERVSAVFVTLNGPEGGACSVPVFATTGDTPPPPPPPGTCTVSYAGTTTLLDTTWPAPVWPAALVDNFTARPGWSVAASAAVTDSASELLLSGAGPGCVSFVAIAYDPTACVPGFFGDTSQLEYIGESDSPKRVVKLYGIITTARQWNVCATLTGPIYFHRTP
jgi:hypothetical protein